MNLEEWYQWLAAFTGLLCKKHGWVGGCGWAGGTQRGRAQRCAGPACRAPLPSATPRAPARCLPCPTTAPTRPAPPRRSSEVEVPALLQYVANQLKSSESLDLLVLKEMVQTMTVRWRQGGGVLAGRWC